MAKNIWYTYLQSSSVPESRLLMKNVPSISDFFFPILSLHSQEVFQPAMFDDTGGYQRVKVPPHKAVPRSYKLVYRHYKPHKYRYIKHKSQ